MTSGAADKATDRSVRALEADVGAWVEARNENFRFFISPKTAEQILESLARLPQRPTGQDIERMNPV